MKIQATISSAEYSEYGSMTVQFPIPTSDYENIIDLLGSSGMGHALDQDCYLEKLTGDYPVLKGLERSNINLDELDYLAKRRTALALGKPHNSRRWPNGWNSAARRTSST